jgi:hypothetical protein
LEKRDVVSELAFSLAELLSVGKGSKDSFPTSRKVRFVTNPLLCAVFTVKAGEKSETSTSTEVSTLREAT